MEETRYPSLDAVVQLHNALIERMGSPFAPLLHRDKLESALARPTHAGFYEGADLVRQAALLTVGISQSQAFEDGNKRAALQTAYAFLKMNGLAIVGNADCLADQIILIAEKPQGPARDAEVDGLESLLRRMVIGQIANFTQNPPIPVDLSSDSGLFDI